MTLEGVSRVERQVECATCPWNKNCIEPPSMTEAEVKAKLDESMPTKTDRIDEHEDIGKSLIGGLMTTLMFSGKDTECKVCPTFAAAMKSGPELSQHIKAFMQEG